MTYQLKIYSYLSLEGELGTRWISKAVIKALLFVIPAGDNLKC